MSSPERSSQTTPGPVTFCRMKPSPPKNPAPRRFCQASSKVTDFCATRNVSLRQISDWPGCNSAGTIVPGKRGAKATWPAPPAVKSVMKNEPPPNERFRPANRPPPVCVSIFMASFIQAIVLVWL